MAERPDLAAAALGGFGGLVRAYREWGMLSQERLAERSGLSVRTIRDLEMGRVRRPRGASVRLLADALGLEGGARAEFETAAWDGQRAALVPGAGCLPPAGILCQLPPDLRDFTGRAAQVMRVQEVLAAIAPDGTGAVMALTVTGKAGVGKTALAVHVAHRLRPQFPDGQLYVNLRGTEPHPLAPGEALSRFLRAFGVGGAAIPCELEERAALYRAWLADRRMLVVLDDAANEAQVRPLLPGTASCGVLITSRVPLSGLEAAQLLQLEVLAPEQALVLLGRVAGPARVAAEPEAATAIIGACGRLPLAVRIAGAKLASRPHWPLARIAGLLADERRRLDQLAVGDLEVRASVTLSYQALSSEQQRAFRLLGLLAAPDFAAWVAAALLDTTTQQTEELVDGLAQAQLLEVAGRDQAGQVRYRYHDLLRLYARERTMVEDPHGQRQASLARALGAWLALAEQADQRLPSGLLGVDHGVAPRWPLPATMGDALLGDPLTWLEAERAALTAAVDQAADNGHDELAWDLAGSLTNFQDLRGYLDDWQHTHQAALASARRAGNRRGEASLLRGFGYLNLTRNRLDAAMDDFGQALVAYRQVGDRLGEAHVIREIGAVHQIQARYADAEACYQRAERMLIELGDPRGQAWVRFGLAVVHAERGDLASALAEFEELLAAFDALGDRRGQAWTQRRLGTVHAAQGNLDAATAWLERAHVGLRDIGDRATEALTLRSLGELELQRHDLASARAYLERCLVIAGELGDQFLQAGALASLGSLHHLEADQPEAACCLERSIELWRELKMPLELARTLDRLGAAHLDAGLPASAESAWREALALLEQVGATEAAPVAGHLKRLHETTGRT